MSETTCASGRCAYGTNCNCACYADWIITPPCPPPKLIRSGGYRIGYRDGWKNAYARGFQDAMRQEGRKVA